MIDTAERGPPTLATLLKRLADYGALVCDAPGDDEFAGNVRCAINMNKLSLVQCAGALIDGRWQPAVTFERYYRELFGRELDGRVVKPRKRA